MRFRTSMTAGLSAIGLAAGATLTLATPSANAVPTFPEGWTPPGQMCQQARVVSEDGTPSTIAGLPGVRCGQYLATLSGGLTPETDTETHTETDTGLEESVDDTVEESTEEVPVEGDTTEEGTSDDGTSGEQATSFAAESTTEEDAGSDGSSGGERSGAWASKHNGNKHQGVSKWAHKGKSHPHHPSNH